MTKNYDEKHQNPLFQMGAERICLNLESGWEFIHDFLVICLGLIILLGTYLAELFANKKQMKEIEEDLKGLVLRTAHDAIRFWEVIKNSYFSRMSDMPQKAVRKEQEMCW